MIGDGSVRTDRPPLPLWRRCGWHLSRDSAAVVSAPGSPRVGLAPGIVVRDDARWLRRLLGEGIRFPDDRRGLLAEALKRFVGGTVDLGPAGLQSPGDFLELLRRFNGVPPALGRRWMTLLAERLDACVGARQGEPAEARPGGGGGPRLRVVSLPANTFLCLEAVLEAALAGDAVWIRPSRREPFAPLRLVGALLEAGWPAEGLGLYPTAPETLPLLVEASDRAVLYGGEGLEQRFAGRPNVVVRGPGRARAIVGESAAPEAAAAWLVPRVVGDGGRFCLSLGTILVIDAPAGRRVEEVGRRLAEALDAVPLQAGDDARYPVPTWPEPEAADAVARWIEDRLKPDDRVLTRRPLLQVGRGGEALLAPALVALGEVHDHPLLGVELPFPFAVIAGVEERDVPALLGGSPFVSHYPETDR